MPFLSKGTPTPRKTCWFSFMKMMFSLLSLPCSPIPNNELLLLLLLLLLLFFRTQGDTQNMYIVNRKLT